MTLDLDADEVEILEDLAGREDLESADIAQRLLDAAEGGNA